MHACLDPGRPRKVSYAARRLDLEQSLTVVYTDGAAPKHGDFVLCTVTELGHHKVIELGSGRKARLYEGDEIIVAYGARYAPDHFEAELPDDLGPCDLVAAGGIAAKVRSAHADVEEPTRLRPIGLIGDANGTVVNIADLALGEPVQALHRPTTLVVVGTSMNSGKTTTVASVAMGLTRAGLRVGTAKVTGTAAGGDPWLFRDSGAVVALDFTDAGMATTFRMPPERLLEGAVLLHGHVAAHGVDVIVLEIADGLLHQETAQLLDRQEMRRLVDGVLFAAADSAGALYGAGRLRASGHPLLAVSGRLTMSPLAIREAQAGLDVPVYAPEDLQSPAIADGLLHRAPVEVEDEALA